MKNYAGDLSHHSTVSVIRTITTAYRSCKLFRDNAPSQEDRHDLANFVIFCRKNDLPWNFRNTVEEDYLGSQARQNTIPPRHELDVDKLLAGSSDKDVLTKENLGFLERSQRRSAADHWRVMRKILPYPVWENW